MRPGRALPLRSGPRHRPLSALALLRRVPYDKHVDKPVRRPSPTLYLVLGTMWAVLAIGGWGTSGGRGTTVVFALLAVANLGLATSLLRKQRRADAAER